MLSKYYLCEETQATRDLIIHRDMHSVEDYFRID